MPPFFNEGFFVRKPAWHQMGTVLDYVPEREEAQELAGHNFDVIELDVAVPDSRIDWDPDDNDLNFARINGENRSIKQATSYKALVKKQTGATRDHTNGMIIGIVSQKFQPVQNSVCWDIIDALIGEPNVRYETGGTLRDGKQCFVTAWLDTPGRVPGDDSDIYPYAAVNWAHDGTGAVKCIGTSIREVCANTVAAAEAEASKSGREFVFKHTKNVMDRIEDAKMAIRGIGLAHSEFMELADELVGIKVSKSQRTLFVEQLIPAPPEFYTSERVQNNITEARDKVYGILNAGKTIPEAHQYTGYGLYLAGTEYLDHLRGYRDINTYVGRTLLREEPLKAKLSKLIREVAVA